ncbi:hypothetical protein LCGC14_1473450 [marine sediment metagenome]|uniref:Uncharacterized protein n=1 Tax=marine sediment metagenome TaxID=412755 RepID=A0A0F9JCC3_9ZZZZ
MSLAIDIDKITSVMIGGEWNDVIKNEDGVSSFALDAYEFVWGSHLDHKGWPRLVHGGGAHGIGSAGFEFKTAKGAVVAGPLTAIQAVKMG